MVLHDSKSDLSLVNRNFCLIFCPVTFEANHAFPQKDRPECLVKNVRTEIGISVHFLDILVKKDMIEKVQQIDFFAGPAELTLKTKKYLVHALKI